MQQVTLLRPKEIREHDASIRQAFDESQIGALLWLGLVRGRKIRRGCVVALEDVQKILQYRGELKG